MFLSLNILGMCKKLSIKIWFLDFSSASVDLRMMKNYTQKWTSLLFLFVSDYFWRSSWCLELKA